MKPSSFQTAIRLQFDCLVKRVIDTTVKDYQRELSRRATHEIAFSELPEQELNHVGITDDYDSDYSCFEVLGTKVKVNNEQLADALKILPEKKLRFDAWCYRNSIQLPRFQVGRAYTPPQYHNLWLSLPVFQ